jgi:hypothetical protein
VLDAVEAWPAGVSASRTRRATANLDGVSTRGQQQIMGRDEEKGFRVEQRNKPLGIVLETLPSSPSSSFFVSTASRFFIPTC